MARQASLFPEAPPPRNARVYRAHLYDAGHEYQTEIAKFRCERCGWDSGWVSIANVTEGRRGLPCPTCNAVAP